MNITLIQLEDNELLEEIKYFNKQIKNAFQKNISPSEIGNYLNLAREINAQIESSKGQKLQYTEDIYDLSIQDLRLKNLLMNGVYTRSELLNLIHCNKEKLAIKFVEELIHFATDTDEDTYIVAWNM